MAAACRTDSFDKIALFRSGAMGDKQLHQDILDELEFEPSIDAARIGVAVEHGVVTLTGHVSSFLEKQAVERAVKRVKGVRAIAEEIEVRLPYDHKTTDDEIASRALDVLHWDTRVPDGVVGITVQDGTVILTGTVDWQYQRQAAEDDIRKLSGVAGVINQIIIASRPQTSDVQSRIQEALRRNADVAAEAIQVSVQDGKVILDGKVQSWKEREAAERAAWSAPGVRTVEDRLKIE
jgi:osmotically-inducible protein OsmY